MVAPQRVTARLRIRAGAPSTQAPRLGALEPGSTIYPEAQVVGEAVAGNAAWFQLSNDNYVWGGPCVPAGEDGGVAAPPPNIDVLRRVDGSIRNLSIDQIREIFGNFAFDEAKGGAITIRGDWTKTELTEIDCPALGATPFSRVTVHKKAADAFARVFKAIDDAGLAHLIRTCAGTWVPRHMGWNPNRALSSHSWGIAIDLNPQWNGYGQVPAALGEVGSNREIVSIFEREGFAWGGYFQPLQYTDGMHFEFARRDA